MLQSLHDLTRGLVHIYGSPRFLVTSPLVNTHTILAALLPPSASIAVIISREKGDLLQDPFGVPIPTLTVRLGGSIPHNSRKRYHPPENGRWLHIRLVLGSIPALLSRSKAPNHLGRSRSHPKSRGSRGKWRTGSRGRSLSINRC